MAVAERLPVLGVQQNILIFKTCLLYQIYINKYIVHDQNISRTQNETETDQCTVQFMSRGFLAVGAHLPLWRAGGFRKVKVRVNDMA